MHDVLTEAQREMLMRAAAADVLDDEPGEAGKIQEQLWDMGFLVDATATAGYRITPSGNAALSDRLPVDS
jgi:hypothetical protein